MPSGLTDDQVNGEVSKMAEFIKKEAEEKAKEITLKADEEYEAEKSALVRSETAAIDQAYSAKYKQAKLAQQIVKSTVTNKSRLKVLQAKEEIVDKVVQATAKQLAELPKDAKKYEKFLAKLLDESAELLKEDKIVVQARKADKSVLEKAIKSSKTETEIEISEHPLEGEVSGGIIVATEDGKITIDNTIETRLEILVKKSLPLIRLELFGPSANRKFFD